MKAIVQDRYGSPDVLELRDVPTPTLRDDALLVDVRAASLNAADRHTMRGEPRIIRLGMGLRRPRSATRGTDFAGVVQAVGGRVSGVVPGDEVFGSADGSFAEVARTTPDRIAPKPRGVPFDVAAALPMAATTALQGLRDHAELRAGERVLVNGAAGGVGSFAVQIAKAMGARVTAVTRADRLELARSLGADAVIDHDALDAHEERYDVVFDLGGERGFDKLRALLTPEGRIVSAGAGTREGRALLARPASAMFAKRVRVYVAKESRDDLVAVGKLAEEGKIRPMVERTIALADVADAMRALEARTLRGKVVVRLA